MKIAPWLLVQREALRLARRPRTWVLRFALLTLAVVVLWMGWTPVVRDVRDPATVARRVRDVYYTWLTLTWSAVFVLSPVLAALAVHEEREEDTLELLVLSGLSAVQVVGGKVGARLLGLLAVVVGMAPLLAVVTAFGGVSTSEVVLAVVEITCSSVFMAAVAASVAPVTRGLAAPVLLAWTWALLASFLPALVAETLGKALGAPAPELYWVVTSAPTAVGVASWSGLWGVLFYLPLLAVVSQLLPVALRRSTANDLWLGSAEGRRADIVIGVATLTLAGLVAGSFIAVLTPIYGLPQAQLRAGVLVVTSLLHAAAVALVLAGMLESITVQRKQEQKTSRPDRSGRLSGNPLLWRALHTDGLAPSRWLTGAGLAAYTLFCATWLWAFWEDDGMMTFGLGSAWYFAAVAAGVVAAGVAEADRARGREALLRVTTMPGVEIVRGQVLSVASRSSGVLAIPLLMWVGARLVRSVRAWQQPIVTEPEQLMSFDTYDGMYWDGPTPGDPLAALSHAVDAILLLPWSVASHLGWIAVVLVAIHLVPTGRIAWMAGAASVPVFVFLQVVVLFFLACIGGDGTLLQVVMPLWSDEIAEATTLPPVFTVISLLCWTGFGISMAGVLLLWWRPDPERSPTRPDGRTAAPR